MGFPAFTCRFRSDHQDWGTPRAADAAAVRDRFDAHPVRWLAVAGDAVRTDPPPARLGPPGVIPDRSGRRESLPGREVPGGKGLPMTARPRMDLPGAGGGGR
jgi:hypothetical protein